MRSTLLIFIGFCATAFALEAPFTQNVADAARRAHLDPKLVQAVVEVESNYNARAISRKGAMGLMQVMPATAGELGIHQPLHALDNLQGACQYLRRLINRYSGDLKLALAAYNAGPHNVDRYKGIPPFKETRKYVKRVLRIYDRLKG
ncbi:MAG: lytic transglycosylase domain-containing protein [Bdellovibrionota bacterium]